MRFDQSQNDNRIINSLTICVQTCGHICTHIEAYSGGVFLSVNVCIEAQSHLLSYINHLILIIFNNFITKFEQKFKRDISIIISLWANRNRKNINSSSSEVARYLLDAAYAFWYDAKSIRSTWQTKQTSVIWILSDYLIYLMRFCR